SPILPQSCQVSLVRAGVGCSCPRLYPDSACAETNFWPMLRERNLPAARSQLCGQCGLAVEAPGCRWKLRRGVGLIYGYVEAGLLEFLFHVDLVSGLQAQKPRANPAKFLPGHSALRNVDGGAGEMGTDDVAIGGGGITVHED